MPRALPLALLVACSAPAPTTPLALTPDVPAAAGAEGEAKAPRTLDGSVGGPLRRIALSSVRMTEDVIQESSDELASYLVECDPNFGSLLGTHWYAFRDDECYQGTSTSGLQLLHNGRDGLGCTVRWLGSLRPTFADPFSGIGMDVTRAQLASFSRLRLEVRGDGRRYRAQFPMEDQHRNGAAARTEQPRTAEGQLDCHEEWYDFYGQEFRCGDGSDTWSTLMLDLKALRQVGFGNRVPLNLADVRSLQVVTMDHDAHDFQCELRIVGLE